MVRLVRLDTGETTTSQTYATLCCLLVIVRPMLSNFRTIVKVVCSSNELSMFFL